ncbi:hypothetical protein BH24ACT4_BH24ACT4_18590 [soil metagenome]
MYARLGNRFSATPAGSWLVKHVMAKVDPVVFKATKGRFTAGRPPTLPMLALTTTGRRSGEPRTVQLAYHRVLGGDDHVAAAQEGCRMPPPVWVRGWGSGLLR